MSIGGGSKTPKPTDAERALAERGAREWNRNVEAFAPMAEQFVRDIRTGPDEYAALRRTASATAAEQAASAAGDRALATQGLRAGLAPGSGAHVMGVADASNRYAGGVGAALAAAEPGLMERQTRGLLKAAAYGRGLADHSTSGLIDVGRRTTDAALRASQRQTDEYQTLTSGLAGLGGAAAAGYMFKHNKPKQPYDPQFYPLD